VVVGGAEGDLVGVKSLGVFSSDDSAHLRQTQDTKPSLRGCLGAWVVHGGAHQQPRVVRDCVVEAGLALEQLPPAGNEVPARAA
jgi:hypothetical protein